MALIQTAFVDWIGSIAFDHYVKRNALGGDLIAEVLASLDQFKVQGARSCDTVGGWRKCMVGRT